jgi:hypothetical protein
MAYIDDKGNEWQRIDGDPVCWQRADGFCVYSAPDNTFEYICEMAYKPEPKVKSDAERIAELEAQLAALLSRL